MLRLTETRGVREWPASFHAARNAQICAACWMWDGSPVSSLLSVELWRFIPNLAAQTAVALEPAPHQIRSRNPSECGSKRSRPGGLANTGRGFGCAKPLPLSRSRNFSAWAARHGFIIIAFSRTIAEVARAIDHLLGRTATDPQLQRAPDIRSADPASSTM